MSLVSWFVDGTEYTNKFRAIEASRGQIQNITARFKKQDVFESFDWTQEPEESLPKLITRRCFQLRDSYKYIKLYFSGGSDSTTVLNYFIKNNIFIDEIIVSRNSLIDDFTCESNYEVNTFTIPYLHSIKNLIPKTKIKILDIGSDYYNSIMNESFFYKKNQCDIREFYVPKVRGNNFCHLLCCIEPNLIFEDGVWYDVQYDTANFLEYKYRNIEMFYFTPDLLKLHSKQCHILKNLRKKSNLNGKQLTRTYLRDTAVAPEPDWLRQSTGDSATSMHSFPKSKYQLKNAPFNLRQRYHALLSQTVGGRNMIRLSDGILMSKFNLGE